MSKSTGDLPSQFLVETKDSYIVRAKDAKNEDFDRLFWVNLDGVNIEKTELDADILLLKRLSSLLTKRMKIKLQDKSKATSILAAACWAFSGTFWR